MNARHPLPKFVVFALVCLGFTAWLVVMIGNISFESRLTYAADFGDVQGLLVNDDVKVAGVTVGKVTGIEHLPGGRARVSFSVRDQVSLPSDSTVTVRWRNVLGLRFLYVEPGSGGEVVAAGHVFPLEQTRAPADLGSLLQRLAPFMQALDPRLQNELLQGLSEGLVGNEQEVRSLIAQGAELTTAIAGRDAEIDSLLRNSATVLDAYAAREQELRGLLDSFAEVSSTLAERNDELERAIMALADGQEELQRLVDTNRGEIEGGIDALEDLTTVLAADREGLERALETSPRGLVSYHLMSRTGQWFNIRAVGASVADTVVSTERGAAYPRAGGRSSRSSGAALSELFGGGR
ncbi:MCE family protein [Egicoccus sp. AB-alg2]|uniref:MCE family protein n=1 Tax=Egicoccus sp. AB-alg2 TaxID=3242693 RepID=UPI00359DC26F